MILGEFGDFLIGFWIFLGFSDFDFAFRLVRVVCLLLLLILGFGVFLVWWFWGFKALGVYCVL